MSSPIKNAPGLLKMQCMIWEPNPIASRPAQDYSVVYNATTIKSLPENVKNSIRFLGEPPYGIFLKEKYVYRDTFLKIGSEFLGSDRAYIAENGELLFDTSGKPRFPYIEHQSFQLVGSLLSNIVKTPTGMTNYRVSTEDAFDIGLSKWNYIEKSFPFEHDGHRHEINSSNNHDYIESMNMQTGDPNFETQLGFSLVEKELQGRILARKFNRLVPLQIAASSQHKGTSEENDKAKPIHWLCKKETPLFTCQDFFVEFTKTAYQFDVVADSSPFLSQYAPIDSKYSNVVDGLIRNAGVVDIDKFNNVIKGSDETYNLRSQPYYLIEIGHGDFEHNYYVIIAYNAFPIFVQVGKFSIFRPGSVLDGIVILSPSVEAPLENISRRLSTFDGDKGVSCKQLMDQETLRLSVRCHLGKLIITFSGHENNPWIISRADLVDKNARADRDQNAVPPPLDIVEKSIPIVIPSKSIQIGGGNGKCGFTFGPLHYQEYANIEIANAITVKGPLKQEDINLELGERGIYKDSDGKFKKQYFQDAEVYMETIKGADVITKKTDIACPWPIKISGKDTTVRYNFRNSTDGERVSYIYISMDSKLQPEEAEETEALSEDNYLKWFNASFYIGSGDASVPTTQLAINSQYWRIENSITPVASGWRMDVPKNSDKEGHGQKPVDVAHHVETFSHNWSYSDNAKVEHSGNLRFRINLGTPTSLSDSTDAPQTSSVNNSTDTSDVISSTLTDQSEFLTSLSDKTFFIRVYAWWEGGYMDCKNSICPCKIGAGITDRDRRCVFTGIAHGGEITIEGNTRFMECQLFDYMKIVSDQYFLNSPFFDGMNDYFAISTISNLAGFTETQAGFDPYPPAKLIKDIAQSSVSPPAEEWIRSNEYTNESMFFSLYTLPSAYDILQSPFMKFADGSKYDEALNKIAALANKVAYFDRFGILRYDITPDKRFFYPIAKKARRPKCNFMASPFALRSCFNLDLMALNQYTYKKNVADVVNDILLVTATPQGEVLVKSVVNLPNRYDPSSPGYIGYTKRLLQMDGIFGSEKALETYANYLASIVFKPPLTVTWESMGVPHLQAMDIVTFTGLNDDLGFPKNNIETPSESALKPPTPSVTLILTSVSGEIIPQNGEWRNKYEGEWLYGDVK